jgi:hypothetical protein
VYFILAMLVARCLKAGGYKCKEVMEGLWNVECEELCC